MLNFDIECSGNTIASFLFLSSSFFFFSGGGGGRGEAKEGNRNLGRESIRGVSVPQVFIIFCA